MVFWNKLKEKVEAIESKLIFYEKTENKNHPDFEMYDMRIKAPRSDSVSVSVAHTKEAERNSLKFAMFFQGYGVYPGNPRPLKDYFTVLVNAHSIPNRETDEFYSHIRDHKLNGYGY